MDGTAELGFSVEGLNVIDGAEVEDGGTVVSGALVEWVVGPGVVGGELVSDGTGAAVVGATVGAFVVGVGDVEGSAVVGGNVGTGVKGGATAFAHRSITTTVLAPRTRKPVEVCKTRGVVSDMVYPLKKRNTFPVAASSAIRFGKLHTNTISSPLGVFVNKPAEA